MFGSGLDAVTVVIILEFILAVYSLALVFSVKNKWFKIVNIVLAVVWVVLGFLNIFM